MLTGGNLQVVYLAPEGTTAQPEQVLVRFDPSSALKRIADMVREGKRDIPVLQTIAQDGTGVFTEYTSYTRSLLNLPAASIVATRAVEYYNHVFDHYFITPVAAE